VRKIILFILAISFLSVTNNAFAETVTLLTADEVAMANAKAPEGFEEKFALLETVKSEGPAVKILKPEPGVEHKSPVSISIDFIPKQGTHVDLTNLKVEVLKFITINITGRVKDYANEKGIRVERADFPSGKHRIRLTVGDDKGGITEQIFAVKVL
jgi:hypothetical protein